MADCRICEWECEVDAEDIYIEINEKWLIHLACMPWLAKIGMAYELMHIDDWMDCQCPVVSG